LQILRLKTVDPCQSVPISAIHKSHQPRLKFNSLPINILAVTNSLNFDDLLSGNDFIHEPVVADAYSIGVLSSRKLLAARWKWISGKTFGGGDDSWQFLPRELAQVFLC